MKKTLSDITYQNNRKMAIDKIVQGLKKHLSQQGDVFDLQCIATIDDPIDSDTDEESNILNSDHLDPNETQGYCQEELNEVEFHKGESKDMDEDESRINIA